MINGIIRTAVRQNPEALQYIAQDSITPAVVRAAAQDRSLKGLRGLPLNLLDNQEIKNIAIEAIRRTSPVFLLGFPLYQHPEMRVVIDEVRARR